MSLADLVLGYILAAGPHPVLDALHGEVLGNQEDVYDDGVVGGTCRMDEIQLGGMGEHRLGDERPAQFDEPGPSFGGDTRRVVGVREGIVGPTLLGDLVGVDEYAAGEQRRKGQRDERRLSRPIGSDDEVGALHRSALARDHGRCAVGPVLDDPSVVVHGDHRDTAGGEDVAVVGAREALIDRGGDLGVEDDAVLEA
jgi:hypothetical protein